MDDDDNHRLIRLISLVAWMSDDRVDLRFLNDADRTRLTEDEQTAGHEMFLYYFGAVVYHQANGDSRHELDRRLLPDFTLAFVTNLSDDAVAALGEIVGSSLLAPAAGVNPAVLGRQWVDDVSATCWRLKLAGHEDDWSR